MSHEDRSSRVNHAAARPLWQQVADDLRNDIQTGHLSPGSRLPSETELAYQGPMVKACASGGRGPRK